MKEILLNIPSMSVNRCFQGRRFMTKEYKDWTEAGLWLLKGQKPVDKPYYIDITFYQSQLADIDGGVKALLDLLKKAEIIEDDRYVMTLRLNKVISKKKKIVIRFY